MTEEQIVGIFADGEVYRAITLAHEAGLTDLVNNFKKSVDVFNEVESYKRHYRGDNGRIAGLQITDNWGADFRQVKSIDHLRELKGDHMLDVGCADGSFIFLCLKAGVIKKATGVDPWEGGIRWATKYAEDISAPASFINGILDDAALSNTYDVIHFGEVLEHVIDPVSTIKRALSFSSDFKGIVITVPIGRPPITQDEIATLTKGQPAEHIRHITLDTIKGYCSELGLAVVKEDVVGSTWTNLIVTLRRK